MNCFDTNARKREILDHLEVRIQILFSWVWEIAVYATPHMWRNKPSAVPFKPLVILIPP